MSSNSKYWLLGAISWVALTVVLILVATIWPEAQQSRPFFYAVVLGCGVGGFALIYFFGPKRGD